MVPGRSERRQEAAQTQAGKGVIHKVANRLEHKQGREEAGDQPAPGVPWLYDLLEVHLSGAEVCMPVKQAVTRLSAGTQHNVWLQRGCGAHTGLSTHSLSRGTAPPASAVFVPL